MAGRIPQQFVDDLLARVDIVDLVESYLPLRKAGRDFQALCPFHGEKTPSFTISREKQFYHCFGCGAHGSAIGFLMNYRNLEFVEAVEELAAIAGVEVPREAQRAQAGNARELYGVLERARAQYEAALRQGPARERAVDYLKNRGISGAVAKQFRVGFAADGWRNLTDALTAAGVGEELLERAGLVQKRDRGSCYDRFRDRIMFPIHDRRGRVVGFGGRIIDQGEPKYLNSPETEVFHKGRELYGLHEALAAGRTLERLIVVEGYMDVIALHQFGLTQVVATLGTAVTRDHLELLFRHVPAVMFCFDGDNAGRRAAWKALEIALPLVEGNRELRFAFLPDGHDPDTAVRAFGADGLFSAATVYGLSDYLLETLRGEVDLATAEGRTRLVARIKPYLMQIPDLTHRAAALGPLASATHFDEDLLRRELGFGGARARAQAASRPLSSYTGRRSLVEQALSFMLQRPSLAACLATPDAEVIRSELEDCALLLEVWAVIGKTPAATTAVLLERWRGHPEVERLAALAAAPLAMDEQAQRAEMEGAVARLLDEADKARFGRIKAIPFAQLNDEQKAFMRAYKRAK